LAQNKKPPMKQIISGWFSSGPTWAWSSDPL